MHLSRTVAEALYTLLQKCDKVKNLPNVKVYGRISKTCCCLSTLNEVILQARKQDLMTILYALGDSFCLAKLSYFSFRFMSVLVDTCEPAAVKRPSERGSERQISIFGSFLPQQRTLCQLLCRFVGPRLNGRSLVKSTSYWLNWPGQDPITWKQKPQPFECNIHCGLKVQQVGCYSIGRLPGFDVTLFSKPDPRGTHAS